jgi:hypothetical protein
MPNLEPMAINHANGQALSREHASRLKRQNITVSSIDIG